MSDSILKQLAKAKGLAIIAAVVAAIDAIKHPLDILRGFGSAVREPWRSGTGARRLRKRGDGNPDGAKLLRQFYRNKHGVKGTYEEALSWYSKLAEYVTGRPKFQK